MLAVAADRISIERMRQLFNETPQDVFGRLPNQQRSDLRVMSQKAAAAQKFSMARYGLRPLEYSRERLYAEPIPPRRDGLVQAYTDGFKQVINTHTVAGTPEYEIFMKMLGNGEIGGEMAGYLYSLFGDPKRAKAMNEDALYHESGHTLTQKRGMQMEDGSIAEPIANITFRQLYNYFDRNLPGDARYLAPLCTLIAFTANIEGMNELQKENAKNGKNARTVSYERAGGMTTYDVFTEAAADAAYDMKLEPRSEIMNLYRLALDNPSYIEEFASRNRINKLILNEATNVAKFLN